MIDHSSVWRRWRWRWKIPSRARRISASCSWCCGSWMPRKRRRWSCWAPLSVTASASWRRSPLHRPRYTGPGCSWSCLPRSPCQPWPWSASCLAGPSPAPRTAQAGRRSRRMPWWIHCCWSSGGLRGRCSPHRSQLGLGSSCWSPRPCASGPSPGLSRFPVEQPCPSAR